MLETFTLSTFTDCQNKNFKLHLNPDQILDFELVKATASPLASPGENPREGARQGFSLVFCGPRELWLPQSIYPFEHPGIGSFEMFIVPIGVIPEGYLYEAVFN